MVGEAIVQGIVTSSLTVDRGESGGGISKLYIAGRFHAVGSVLAEGLAVFDGFRWQKIGDGPKFSGGIINTIIAFRGDLYVGGSFSKIGNTHMAGFARWDGVRYVKFSQTV